MKRRDFLNAALVGGATLAAGCGGPSAAGPDGAPAVATGKRVRWRFQEPGF